MFEYAVRWVIMKILYSRRCDKVLITNVVFVAQAQEAKAARGPSARDIIEVCMSRRD